MDNMYSEFIKVVENFLHKSNEAPHHLTKAAISEGELTSGRLKKWNHMLSHVQKNYESLKKLIEENKPESNSEIQQLLNLYQTLPRWFEESPCLWSTDYENIKQDLKSMFKLRKKLLQSENLK